MAAPAAPGTTDARADAPPRWATVANVAAAVTAFVILVAWTATGPQRNVGGWSYSAGEWLINYGSGFVRRGFAGELLLRLPAPSDLIALEVWLIGMWAAILVLFAVLVRRCMVGTGSPWVLALWLLPSWFIAGPLQMVWRGVGPSFDQFPMRKEQWYLLVVVVAAVLWSRGRPAGWRSATLVSGLLLVGALTHEGLLIPSCAAVALLGWRATTGVRARLLGALLVFAPAAVGFVAVVLNPGTASDRMPIWLAVDETTRRWYVADATPPMSDGVPGAMSFIGVDAREGLRSVADIYFSDGLWVWWLATAVVMIGAPVLIMAMSDRSRSGLRALAVTTAVMVVGAVPLFVVAFDWGRWVAFLVNLIIVVSLARIASAVDPEPVAVGRWSIVLVLVAVLVPLAVGLPELGDIRPPPFAAQPSP